MININNNNSNNSLHLDHLSDALLTFVLCFEYMIIACALE